VGSGAQYAGEQVARGAGAARQAGQATLAAVSDNPLLLGGLGVAVGALLAAGAAKAVSGALYGVGFLDPVTWIGATVTLFCVAALANAVPARRAAVVDPSSALRSD
jgi:hypothetical protein